MYQFQIPVARFSFFFLLPLALSNFVFKTLGFLTLGQSPIEVFWVPDAYELRDPFLGVY
jgi:hypothetical protein